MDARRWGAIGVLAMGALALPGCGQPPAPASGQSGLAAPDFSLDTPVEKIAADARGKAILERDLPGLMSNRSYILFNDMSLSQLASMSAGRLTKAKLAQVQADLTQLSRPPPQ